MERSLQTPEDATESAHPLILIVDDDFAVRDSLAAVIESFGYRTRTAGDGFEGLREIESEPPSAIITDLQMPGMDGFALLKAPMVAEAGIPVIAISGGIPQEHDLLAEARRMGAVATFPKPLPIVDVIAAIDSLTHHAAA